MPPTAEFEPAVPLSERPLTHARPLGSALERYPVRDFPTTQTILMCFFFQLCVKISRKIRRLDRDRVQILPNLSVTLSLALFSPR